MALMIAAILAFMFSETMKPESNGSDVIPFNQSRVPGSKKTYSCFQGELMLNLDPFDSFPPQRPDNFPYYDDALDLALESGESYDKSTDSILNRLIERRVRSITAADLSNVNSEVITVNDLSHANTLAVHKHKVHCPEFAGDVCKWMMFNALSVNGNNLLHVNERFLGPDQGVLYFVFGTISAIAGKIVHDVATHATVKRHKVGDSGVMDSFSSMTAGIDGSNQTTRTVREGPVATATRYGYVAIQGGMLFGTYHAAMSFLSETIPVDWNREFLFESVLEQVEEEITESIPPPFI